MRILVIPDLHGKTVWKNIKNPGQYDKIVFMGDYMDSFTHTTTEILNNIADIVEFQIQNPDRVILLLGNHEIQYTCDHQWKEELRCSGYRSNLKWKFRNEIYPKGKFQAAYGIGNYLFIHAGLSNKSWTEHYERTGGELLSEYMNKYPDATHAELLSSVFNKLWQLQNGAHIAIGEVRGGRFETGSIFWADKSETEAYPVEGIIQIVGHTPVKNITVYPHIIYTDCLDSVENGFLELNIQ